MRVGWSHDFNIEGSLDIITVSGNRSEGVWEEGEGGINGGREEWIKGGREG